MAKCKLRDCELTHCTFGHHIEDGTAECLECDQDEIKHGPRCEECGEFHDPKKITCEELDAVADAERAAGWDPNP